MINPNVAKLKLPRNMKRLSSSFNDDLLYPYTSNTSEFAGRPKTLPFILELDTDTGEELHIVGRLLRSRQRSRQIGSKNVSPKVTDQEDASHYKQERCLFSGGPSYTNLPSLWIGVSACPSERFFAK